MSHQKSMHIYLVYFIWLSKINSSQDGCKLLFQNHKAAIICKSLSDSHCILTSICLQLSLEKLPTEDDKELTSIDHFHVG